MKEELWYDIPGLEGMYIINSTFDIVKSVKRIIEFKDGRKAHIKERRMTIGIGVGGYKRIQLSKNNRKIILLIHRIKGILTIPNPENKSQINHTLGDKLDNDHIEWATPKENMQHAFRIGLNSNKKEKHPMWGRRGQGVGLYGRKGALHPMFGKTGDKHPTHGKQAKGKDNPASKIVLDLQTGIFYDTAKEAAFAKGIKPTTLRGNLNGTTKINNTSLIYA